MESVKLQAMNNSKKMNTFMGTGNRERSKPITIIQKYTEIWPMSRI